MSIVFILSESTDVHVGIGHRGEVIETWPADADPSASSELLASIIEAVAANSGSVAERFEQIPQGPGIYYADGGTTTTTIQYIVAAFGAGGALVFLKAVKSLLMQWLKNKQSRSVTVKLGDVEISVKGNDDVQKVLRAMKKLQLDDVSRTVNPGSTEPVRPKKPRHTAVKPDDSIKSKERIQNVKKPRK